MPENFEINFDVLKQNLEFLDEGLLIVDSGLKIVIANQRFVELLDIPERMKQSGTTIEEIFLYKAERGNYGPDQTEVLVASKLARARLMQAHQFRWTRPDGTVVEVKGNPLPGGGFITLYRDVTRDAEETRLRAEELNAAHKLQTSLMPSDRFLQGIAADCGLQIKALCRQADEVGGDFWGLHQLDENRVAFFLVDTVGHGLVASLNAFRVHTFISQYFANWQSLDGWVAWVNGQMLDLLETGHFATFVFGILDRQNRQLTYAAGGYPPFLLGRFGDEADPVFADTKGLPLGVSRNMKSEIRELLLPRDWSLLFYSDALIEEEYDHKNFLMAMS